MADTNTLNMMAIVLARITDIMDNHQSEYRMTKDTIAKARAKVADSPKKALKLCDAAYRYALGESLVVIRYQEIIGEVDFDDLRKNNPSIDPILDKYKSFLDIGEYDKALSVLEELGKKVKGSIPPQILSVTLMDYTIPESKPVVELAVTNVSEKSLIVETLSVSPPYCRVVSDPNVALYSGDSTYISIELDCVEGKYPLMYTLSYSVGLDRVVKRGTFSINVIDDEE